jgi:hypothetical protein
VNFSIDFKMGRLSSKAAKADVVAERRETEGTADAQPSCPVVDDIVAGTDDAGARERAERALQTYGGPPAEWVGPRPRPPSA